MFAVSFYFFFGGVGFLAGCSSGFSADSSSIEKYPVLNRATINMTIIAINATIAIIDYYSLAKQKDVYKTIGFLFFH